MRRVNLLYFHFISFDSAFQSFVSSHNNLLDKSYLFSGLFMILLLDVVTSVKTCSIMTSKRYVTDRPPCAVFHVYLTADNTYSVVTTTEYWVCACKNSSREYLGKLVGSWLVSLLYSLLQR